MDPSTSTNTTTSISLKVKQTSYHHRSLKHFNPLIKKILNLMEFKKSNLCVSLDVTNRNDFFKILNCVGQYVCMIKTHIDIIEDFDQSFIMELKRLSQKYNFFIFEDRKFADIGNTVKYQYSSGIYKIVEWSDIINAHTIPGESIIKSLSSVVKSKQQTQDQTQDQDQRGCLLLAEMSSRNNLIRSDYTLETIKMARKFQEFVIGFISQRRLEGIGIDQISSTSTSSSSTMTQSDHLRSDQARLQDQDQEEEEEAEEDFLILSPGVRFDLNQDQSGQTYRTPHEVIHDSGSDIIIVGRGIYTKSESDHHDRMIDHSQDSFILDDHEIVRQAIRYQQAGWEAYVKRLKV